MAKMLDLMRSLTAVLATAFVFSFPQVGAQQVDPYKYTIINGQIFTPGLAIVDAPQPNTPLGGENLHVALDVSYNGAIGQPPYPKSAPNKIYNITLFLASYDTRLNLTISNGTASAGNGSLGDILAQEPGSTVKHVNWLWPDCLVGIGAPKNGNSARGSYNISMHQFFRLNGSDYHTIFDLPIQVTNEISASRSRPTCDSLSNKLLPAEQGNATGPQAVLPYSVLKEGLKGFAAGLARADVRVVAVVAGVIACVAVL